MASLLALTTGLPTRALKTADVVVTAGDPPDGDMYILESGRLSVERDGVVIATIAEPGALIGEMSVLLGIDHSATVRAATPAVVRVVDNAIAFMERTPLVALEVATLACARLDATSGLLVELRKEAAGKAGEQSLLSRIVAAMMEPPKRGAGRPIAAHE